VNILYETDRPGLDSSELNHTGVHGFLPLPCHRLIGPLRQSWANGTRIHSQSNLANRYGYPILRLVLTKEGLESLQRGPPRRPPPGFMESTPATSGHESSVGCPEAGATL